jgi:hypothetical protein
VLSIRELLSRFRPAGAPGAAGRAAVPADRLAEHSAELAAIFDLLAATHAEAARIRTAAAVAAERRNREANEEALRIVAAARARADAERAAAFAAARADAETAGGALVDQARRDADEIRQRVDRRLAEYVARLVAVARREAAGQQSGTADEHR